MHSQRFQKKSRQRDENQSGDGSRNCERVFCMPALQKLIVANKNTRLQKWIAPIWKEPLRISGKKYFWKFSWENIIDITYEFGQRTLLVRKPISKVAKALGVRFDQLVKHQLILVKKVSKSALKYTVKTTWRFFSFFTADSTYEMKNRLCSKILR